MVAFTVDVKYQVLIRLGAHITAILSQSGREMRGVYLPRVSICGFQYAAHFRSKTLPSLTC